MELLTIILSGLLAAVSPVGIVLDQIIANNIRNSLKEVDVLAVRVDNAPSYQILQGKAERVRIASRGVQPIPGLRIDTLELETDPIHVDLQALQSREPSALLQSLKEPIQGGVRLVLTEEDLNRALQSPEILSRLQGAVDRAIAGRLPGGQSYKILQSRIDLLENNRVRVEAKLAGSEEGEQNSQPTEIILELGVKAIAGKNLQLIDPTATLNGRRLSSRLLSGLAQSLTEQLDLGTFEAMGITARLLKLTVEDDRIDLAAFFRLEASKPESIPKKEQ